MSLVELALGLVLMLAGGEALVRGSVAVAERLGVSPLVIGLTLVGFGTSTPELVASLEAALIGAPGIAIGNVVGSNIANILLILGVSAVVFPMATARASVLRDGAVMIGASLALLAVVLAGRLGPGAGAAFLAGLAAYTAFASVSERRRATASGTAERDAADRGAGRVGPAAGAALWRPLLVSLAGIAGVIFGASLLVGAAVEIARAAGLSEAVIGLTLVAVGTSLPELATSLMAALRRESALAFGNVIGSNIFNILGIAGLTAVIAPIDIPARIAVLDIWVMVGAALLLVVFALSRARVSRAEGGLLLGLYAGYLAVSFAPGLSAPLGLGPA